MQSFEVNPSSCFEYNNLEAQWTESNNQTSSIQKNADNLRVSHYNVLYPAANFITRPETRYSHHMTELLPKLASDVICLNESNSVYLQTMQETDWIREGYISHLRPTPDTQHEVMIFSKRPFRCYRFQGIGSDDHRYLGALINLDESHSILVLAVHLTAREEHHDRRSKELSNVCQVIQTMITFEKDKYWKKLLQTTIEQNNIIICGDLNLHSPFETQIIYNNNFRDVWLDIYSNHHDKNNYRSIEDADKMGYTWDPLKNSLINLMLLYDNRRMRLDRILLKSNAKLLKCKNIKIFGQENIGLFLHPSDHFGLVADFDITSIRGNKGNALNDEEKKNDTPLNDDDEDSWKVLLSQRSTGFRSIKTIIALRVATAVCPLLAIFGLV